MTTKPPSQISVFSPIIGENKMRARIILTTLLLCTPAFASAASLSFEPSHARAHAGDAISFDVVLSAGDSINAVGTAIQIPAGLAFVSASKGTVFTQWVETPAFDADTNAVEFSGIMAGGWTGAHEVLTTITVKAEHDGDYTPTFDPAQTELYKNDGKATPDVVTFGTIGKPVAASVLLGFFVALLLTVLFFWIVRHKVMIRFV